MFIRRFVGLDAVIPNDLVEALHRHIEDKTFITVDLPLLIIGEGTQLEDVAPVRILKDLGIDYIGQCNFVVTFIQRKDDGWLRRGGSYGLDSKVSFYRHSPVGGGGGVCRLQWIWPCSWECASVHFILQVLNCL